ncbi:uncharacterized protein LOC116205430 [Punica granatum]|uniref:Uncharacterized protein n=2 Tax=Punica granatum TaxID=22663 RepID=A0A218XIY7_PUNGR|nr:uncharacterized protein LOC116205430 [Punica granatum]OWM84649.1 hypothetical protein CDL15_Pgr027436 [Punica granatum]PKI69938.1 hypothetical protein CRG98_009813 [Punica granatum]
MATLQRFKLLATQCAVAPSPTRSPAASPVIHLRRRKTLRMLLGRTDRRKFQRTDPPVPRRDGPAPERSREFRVRHKLKDLFVSSPPPLEGGTSGKTCEDRDHLLTESPSSEAAGELSAPRRVSGPLRPLSAALRYRLLRKAWRPVLGAIPE